ncbi:zinc finger c-x8-C-x5-C-x3-H type (and similar) domain-containing protein [Ditylenchus destructor]|uniref:Zinc finger c-x8-C-x5-C-x3-H type (And similar) domain-containing protein n=1 Tax=Ditylenchus destructor TaxID=166010 RepID=A0AAD4MKL8_9BILA|nr:zinc finger c-x8-C-x5-C-x3-H type (and similar) domain-containing protein [Ditylenchus destructor]
MDFNSMEALLAKAEEMRQRLLKQANNTEAFIKTVKTMHKSAHWKNPKLYKTTVCTHWRDTGKCKFGIKCWYAHGLEELRTPSNGTASLSSMEQLSSARSTPIIPDSDRSSVYQFNDEAQRYPSHTFDPYFDVPQSYNINTAVSLNQGGSRAFGFNNQINGNSYSTGYFSSASSMVDSLNYQRNLTNQIYEPPCFDSKTEQPLFSNNPQNIWSYASVCGRKQEMFANEASMCPQNLPSVQESQIPFGQSFHMFGDSYPLQDNSYPSLSSLNQKSFNPAPGAVPNVKPNF